MRYKDSVDMASFILYLFSVLSWWLPRWQGLKCNVYDYSSLVLKKIWSSLV